MDYIHIIADGARGIYLPQVLLELNPLIWGKESGQPLLTHEEREILEAGPEHELYYEVFEDVIDEAVGTPGGQGLWRLTTNEHTGDLIAYNVTALEQLKECAVRVCVDCQAMLYGLDPDADTTETEDFRRERQLIELAESMGCLAEGSPVPDEFEGWDDDLSDNEFSFHACDGCGTSMGGRRVVVVLVPDLRKEA